MELFKNTNWSRFLPRQETVKKPSVLLIIFVVFFGYWFFDFLSPYNAAKKETNFHFDVFNYYSYLPAKFCNKGSFSFGEGIPSGYNPVGPKGTYVPKTTYGMALMYSPFFALGYKIAYNSKTPLTGFTEEFAYCIRGGSMFYMVLGLVFLRLFLLSYFNETVTTITLFLTLFGTLLFTYGFTHNEMSHGYLFCLFSIYRYLVRRWHLWQ